jgi:hypothetical protein
MNSSNCSTFDQLVGDIPLERDDFLDHPLVVEHDLRFLHVEVDGPAPAASPLEDLEQVPHPLEQRHQ